MLLPLLLLTLAVVSSFSAPSSSSSSFSAPSSTSSSAPSITFKRRWKTKIQNFPMAYGSVSMAVNNNSIFVLNGAEVGNYVLQFDLEGNYTGEWPGWYNWPDEMVVGPGGELLVSALGAMADDHSLAPGLVAYSAEGKFLHGFHQGDSGFRNPYGVFGYPGNNSRVLVADWGSNRTAIVVMDWATGELQLERNLTSVPYPFRLAATPDRLAVISMVCCETWQAPLKALHIYSLPSGSLLKTVQQLPDGRTLGAPQSVATDAAGRVLMVDGSGGVNATLVFSGEGDHLGDLPVLGTPHKMLVQDGHLYTLTEEQGEDMMDVYVNVYAYN